MAVEMYFYSGTVCKIRKISVLLPKKRLRISYPLKFIHICSVCKNDNWYRDIVLTKYTKKSTSKIFNFLGKRPVYPVNFLCPIWIVFTWIYNDMWCITLQATESQLHTMGHLCHKPRLSTSRWGRCINFSKPVLVTLVHPYRSMFVMLVKFSAIEAKLMSVIWVHWPIFKTRRSWRLLAALQRPSSVIWQEFKPRFFKWCSPLDIWFNAASPTLSQKLTSK